MRSDTARAIQLSEMDFDRIRKLHDYEKKLGRILTPGEINEIGKLPRHGDMEMSLWDSQERIIGAITRDELQTYLSDQKSAGEITDSIEFQHLLDLRIRQRVSFVIPKREALAKTTRKSLYNPEAA